MGRLVGEAKVKSAARENRYRQFLNYLVQGRVLVVHDNNPIKITFQIGKLTFSEPRRVFPTRALFAKVLLLIAAGADAETPVPDEQDRIAGVTAAVTTMRRLRV